MSLRRYRGALLETSQQFRFDEKLSFWCNTVTGLVQALSKPDCQCSMQINLTLHA